MSTHSHPHHYGFAHRALPQFLFSSPAQFFTILSSPRAAEFLGDVWRIVGETCAKVEEPVADPVEKWTHHNVKLGNYPAVLVELPAPQETVEAHYLAAVLLLDIAAETQPDLSTVKMRYFTLEKNGDVPTGAMLCEWDYSDGRTVHSNHGDGPAPGDIKAFARAVAKLLETAAAPDA